MELWQWLGTLHPKLVQFPLVLLLAGLVFDLAGHVGRRAWAGHARWAGLASTAGGTLGLLFAFICGIYAEIWAGRAGVPQHPIELHELMANVASWGFVILLAWRIFLTPAAADPAGTGMPQPRGRGMTIYLLLGFTWYLLLAVTGYLGGKLVFEYGAAVSGAGGMGGVLSLADLNTLAARQTDENLRYSEWMHHVFGWMTLGLAASLLAQAIWPGQARRLRWIVPAFLLAGGVFLFFMADRDLYQLTDPRQWRDREVQLHKSLATIMAVIGAAGLRKQWKQRGTAGAEAEGGTGRKASNSRLVAVLALIGGSLLFTHVHTVAPYANVAAGVYIAHVVLGLVALGIGATRLAQDWVAGERWRRRLAVGFAGLMAVEAVLLVTYNEGLPWYIGYGRYNRWGPDESYTVAPFGRYRALLRVDQEAGEARVSLRDRFTDGPSRVAVEGAQLLLAQGGADGGEAVALPLRRTGDDEFVARAEFLKSAAFLSARLVVRRDGRDEAGYFDPWVTPVIAAVPPNERAAFECPMHEGIRAATAGACRLCGMALQPIRPERTNGELHDAEYGLRVTPAGGGAAGGLVAQFLLQPTKRGEAVAELAIVHEQPIHLIVVSEDLAYFDHVHPLPEDGGGGAGAFAWRYAFPRAGRYVLFADYTPRGDRAQVFRVPLQVEASAVHVAVDEAPAARALAVDAAPAKLVAPVRAGATPQDSAALDETSAGEAGGGVRVQLVSAPRTLAAGIHGDLRFRLTTAGGQPVTDLKPYLAALGHCVIVSEDTRTYLHCHPLQLFTPGPGARGGPEVAFHALFPAAGRYKVWAQFKRPGEGGGEELVIAPFTVEVKRPVVPAGVVNFLLGE
jgi:uncharacterized membrane protein/FtsH-binding integral membrane protein